MKTSQTLWYREWDLFSEYGPLGKKNLLDSFKVPLDGCIYILPGGVNIGTTFLEGY